MRPWPSPALRRLAAGAALWAAGAGCDHIETGEMVGSLCDPGEEVFCRCDNGSAGTRTCGDEGGGFEGCSCDADPAGSGGGGGSGGAGGGPPGDAPLLAPCNGDADCASGTCALGFCTVECAAAAECPSSSSCARFAGVMQLCMPVCAATAECSDYGDDSSCGWVYAADGEPATVCADWPAPSLPPEGTDCDDHLDCHLGHVGAQTVCAFGKCTTGCVQPSDCPAGSTCQSSGAPIGTCA